MTVCGVILIQNGRNPLYAPLTPSVWNVLIIASTGEVYRNPLLSKKGEIVFKVSVHYNTLEYNFTLQIHPFLDT